MQGYLFFLVIEFAIWNIGFGLKLDSLEYVPPLLPAFVARVLFRWSQSKTALKSELETIVGRDEMLKLIRRVDEAHKKVEGFRSILLAAQVLSPLWPILGLIPTVLLLGFGYYHTVSK